MYTKYILSLATLIAITIALAPTTMASSQDPLAPLRTALRGTHITHQNVNIQMGEHLSSLPAALTASVEKKADTSETIFPINELPFELCLLIFSFLDNTDLVLGVAPVCKTWTSLARDQMLWINRWAFIPGTHYAEYDEEFGLGDESEDAKLAPYIASFKMQAWPIKRFQFNSLSDAPAIAIVQAIGKLRSIRWHSKYGVAPPVFSISVIEAMQPYLSGLQEFIDRKHFAKDTSGLAHLLQLPSLSTLQLGFAGLTTEDIGTICRCTSLTSLIMSDSEAEYDLDNTDEVNEVGTEYMTSDSFSQMRNLTNLTSLKLQGLTVGDDIYKQTIPALRGLKHLYLTKSYLSPFEVHDCLLSDPTLIEISKGCSKLLTIDLRGCEHIHDEGLIQAGKNLPALMALGFPAETTDYGVLEIARRQHNLVFASFHGSNRIKPATLGYLLAQNPSLRKINLMFKKSQLANAIENDALINVINTNSNITHLILNGLDFSEACLLRLCDIRFLECLDISYDVGLNNKLNARRLKNRFSLLPFIAGRPPEAWRLEEYMMPKAECGSICQL